MVAFLYILPLLSCIVLFMITGSYYEWHVYAFVVGGSMAFTGLIHWLMYRHRTRTKEYLGSFIYSIRHDDAWVERQEYTERVSDGKGGYKEVRRVRYIYHPDEYQYYTSIGSSYYFNRNDYDKIRHLWGTPCHHEQICGSHIRGGVRYYQTYEYDDLLSELPTSDPFENMTVYQTMIPITEEHSYVNKIKNSNSIFRFEDISRKRATEMGLCDYPDDYGYDMSPILGLDVDDAIDEQFRLFNAYYGAMHEIRLFLIFFDSSRQGIEIAEKQRSYWKGGNKNEFVICLGISNGIVEWCHAFSWMDEPVLSMKIEDYFRTNPTLDLMALHGWLREHLDEWKCKEFSDFKYIKVDLNTLQYWSLFALTIAANATAVYLLVDETHKLENNYNEYDNHSGYYLNNYGNYNSIDTSNSYIDTACFSDYEVDTTFNR
ncbi:MAG: hypothetical protein IJE73_04350 [Muribaculaceae bacterium]|nr:hypothetical protein [Muribaculaceae bacterium]